MIFVCSLQPPKKIDLKHVLTVRREKVAAALEWLKVFNHFYEDIVSNYR